MNLVVFASDAKCFSSLNNIVNEASNRGINLFVMVCQDTQLKFPIFNKDRFEILTNCKSTNPIFSHTLGVELPFHPDWILLSREKWEPEISIIKEFKEKFNCKVGFVDPNSFILSNAETRLETYSRNRFKNLIDTTFVHSSHSKNQQTILGFEGHMEVVGNPKYDCNTNPPTSTIKDLKKYYNIDPHKKQVLLFSLINSNRENINKLFKEYINNHQSYQFFYKPYPGEPFDSKFFHDYNPSFFLKDCTPILEETHIWGMFNICDIHIGSISSIIHSSLLLKKQYIDFSTKLNIEKNYLDISNVFKSEGVGIENNVNMWMRSFGFNDIQQLKSLLPDILIEKIKELNKKVWDSLESPENLLILFDNFNDNKASKRIIDYILK